MCLNNGFGGTFVCFYFAQQLDEANTNMNWILNTVWNKKKTTIRTEIQSFNFSITDTKQFNVVYDSYCIHLKLPNASEKNEFNFVERLFSVIRKFYRIFCHEASVPQCTVHFSQTHRIRAETAAIFLMLCSAWRVFEDWVLSIEITKFYRAIFLWAEHSVRVVILSVSYTAALFLNADAFQLGMSVIIGITIFGDVFCAVCESRTQSATCFIAK